MSVEKTPHKYCTSLKKTKSADNISPIPRLKTIRNKIGIASPRKYGVIGTPSMIQKSKNTTKVRPKLIREETVLENRNRYLGTFIFVNISAFPIREPIPPFVASEKNEKTIFPQNRYVIK
jgi:hypothetical protein